MKKIALIIFYIIFGHLLIVNFAVAHLALPDVKSVTTTPTGLNFLIVEYKNLEDITFLFKESSRVLGYFEDIEGDKPFFLTLVTSNQLKNIENQGYKVNNLEQNAILSEFILLYNHDINQSNKLEQYAKVYPLSPHYTLIKIEKGTLFDPHSIPDAVQFSPVPFLEGISPPPQTANVISPEPTQVIHNANALSSEKSLTVFIIIATIFISIAALILFTFHKWVKRKSNNIPPKSTELPLQPPMSI